MQTRILELKPNDTEVYNGLIEKHYEKQGTGKLYAVGIPASKSIIEHRKSLGQQDKQLVQCQKHPCF